MAANLQDVDFDEYDKPGAERSRRRRGEDDDLESDLEEELLEEDWLSGKKNPSEVSDEELNDDLLQSDDEDNPNLSGPEVSLGDPYVLQGHLEEGDYALDVVALGADAYEEEGEAGGEGYQQEAEEYAEDYGQEDTAAGLPGDQEGYGEDEGYQDEVLDIQINEPLDGDFQEDEYPSAYEEDHLQEQGVHPEEVPEGMGVVQVQEDEEVEEEEEEEENTGGAQLLDLEEVENEAELEEHAKEESDEEEDEDKGSGHRRFTSERKDASVVRLADAGNKRRAIPETLELSEQAKADLMQFEEQERQKRQGRFGGRGRGGGGRGGGRGGFPGFGMADFRSGGRGRMNNHRPPLLAHMGMQPSSRIPPPHHHHHHHHQQQQQQQHQQHHHNLMGPKGPPPFQEHGGPLSQQPLQPLIPLHLAHRTTPPPPPPPRPQMEPSPRMMSSPPPSFPQQHHQQQPPQSKNIHINPHFRGPASTPTQVPLMSPAQSQPRPAGGPQRFPGPGDFQPHMTGSFNQLQRPPPHIEPFRNQPPPPPPDREAFFINESHFPGQHMFDHQGPGPLSSGNSLHQQQLHGQGLLGFGQPGPAFGQPGQGPLGLFQRDPPRPTLPPQGHQGMVGLNQHGGPPNQPRPLMGPRQPFGQQQGAPFPPPQVPFGMQVQLRGLLHCPPLAQLPHHEPMSSLQPLHQQQPPHHRQDLPHQQQLQHQLTLGEQRPMMHHGQSPFHQQQAHGSPRQMNPRPINPQQRNMANRQRMSSPASKQQMQIPPQRNSNLRELPVAPSNTAANNARPAPTPASNVRPVAKATQGVRPGPYGHPAAGSGRGRGQAVARTAPLPGAGGRTVVRKEIPSTSSTATPQDPDEDEETRQYRLKLEEQKRLREEILRRKEMRRQMQAGARKKELLERLNAQASVQSQNAPPSQPAQPPDLPLQPQQPPQHSLQQSLQHSFQQSLQQSLQQPQQRQFNHRTQPPQMNPNQGPGFPPNGTAQTPQPHPNVKQRLQIGRGEGQHHLLQQGPGQDPQWQQQQQQQQQLQQQQLQQQRRNSGPQNINHQFQSPQAPQRVMPVQGMALGGPGQAREQGPRPGVKRTVMQRSKSTESPQLPQKVRVVKLLGAGASGPMLQQQQQGVRTAPQPNQGLQRKVTLATSPGGLPGPGHAPQVAGGAVDQPQHNRVVVPSRGRGLVRGGAGPRRGQGGRVAALRQGLPCTVSIEGLSSSTTDSQLRSLLNSIGPIQMFKMLPQQRKAVARFTNPQHASAFQMSFHRHMIDLSHIDVSLIDG